jgi:transposase InsO family protein
MAQENRTWGYDRIQGALNNIGHKVSATTIADVLRRRGVEPVPERKTKTTWKEFLNRHWDQIVAADFFTIEVWTKAGLQRFMVLFFIELSTKRVQLGGIGKSPNGLWMEQIARTITDCDDGVLKNSRYLIHDRDPLFTAAFLKTLKQSGMDSVKLPPRSPNLNAYAERFVRSIKEDCLDRIIFFGEDHLRLAVREYLAHYHTERNHQGLKNRRIHPAKSPTNRNGQIERSQRLGGTLSYYFRNAA